MISLRNLYTLIAPIAGVALRASPNSSVCLMDLLISNVVVCFLMNLYSKAYLGCLIKMDPIFLRSFDTKRH